MIKPGIQRNRQKLRWLRGCFNVLTDFIIFRFISLKVKKRADKEIKTNPISGQEVREEKSNSADEELKLKAQLLDLSSEAIFVWELYGPITYWNNGAIQLYGYSQTEAIGCVSHEMLDTIYPDSYDAIRKSLECDGSWRGELIHKHKDGHRIMVESLMKLVHQSNRMLVLETNRDITDRKAYEKELQGEHNLLQSVMNSAGNAHLVLLDRDFNFVRVNETYAASCGYKPEEMIGKNHFNLYPSEEMESIFRKVRDTGHPVEIHDRPFHFPDQPERGVTYWDWTLIPNRDVRGSTNGMLFSLFETTLRVRAEEALKTSEANFRSIFDQSQIGIVISDMEGRMLQSNSSFQRILGYSMEELKGMSFMEITDPGDLTVEIPLVSELINGKRKSYEIEKRYIRKDGQSIWIRMIGTNFLGANKENLGLAMIEDINDRKIAEMALAAAHRQIQSIIDNTPAMIYAFDLDERFLLANITLARLLNSTPGKMVGKRRHMFMSKEDSDRHEENDQKVIRTGEVIKFEEYNNLNDRTITWLTTKFPLYDELGKIYAVGGISTDISDRKGFEDDLKKSNAMLEVRVRERTKELEKLNEALLKSNRELENFAYITSHDLQEPLRMVTSFTQLLAHKYGDRLDQDARDYIGFAVDGAKRMYELINGLLSYSRISRNEVKFSVVDLNKVIEEVRANLKLVIQERNSVVESGDLPEVYADKTQMLQLLQNLVANGIKFSSGDPHIIISYRKEESSYLFAVKDEGIGIESQYFDKIFEIFRRLHQRDQYPGTGIGLAICKRIVENHNGKIWVESEPGKGSVFYFTLPEPGNKSIRGS